MTCKSCIHYGRCELLRVTKGLPQNDETCCFFLNKSRFIELPCAMGETVYVSRSSITLPEMDVIDIPKVFEARVVSIRMDSNGFFFKTAIDTRWFDDKGLVMNERFYTFNAKSIGSVVFFSQEEAQKALANKV